MLDKIRREQKIPGGSSAVINEFANAWAKGFGDVDLNSRKPVETDTLFQAQSIAKILTSLAVVKLLNRKGIALDEPVNRYLTNWKIPKNIYTKKVTVTFHQLLNHTAAISDPYPDCSCGPK